MARNEKSGEENKEFLKTMPRKLKTNGKTKSRSNQTKAPTSQNALCGHNAYNAATMH